MKNIVLIGMPACGKSTIGYWLSKKIDYPFFDTDKYLEERESRIISDIFSNEGEDYFRELETKYLKELSKKLTKEHGKGFSKSNLFNMRKFYLKYQNMSLTEFQNWFWAFLLLIFLEGWTRANYGLQTILQ